MLHKWNFHWPHHAFDHLEIISSSTVHHLSVPPHPVRQWQPSKTHFQLRFTSRKTQSTLVLSFTWHHRRRRRPRWPRTWYGAHNNPSSRWFDRRGSTRRRRWKGPLTCGTSVPFPAPFVAVDPKLEMHFSSNKKKDSRCNSTSSALDGLRFAHTELNTYTRTQVVCAGLRFLADDDSDSVLAPASG